MEDQEPEQQSPPLPLVPRPVSSDLQNPQKKPPPRLVCVGQIYHQNPHEQPVSVESKWVKLLRSDDQPLLKRRGIAGAKWQLLDYGWVKEPFLVIIENLEGKFTQVIPKPEEITEADKLVLEIGYPVSGPMMLVYPGLDTRFTPSEIPAYIRCRDPQGQVKFAISLIPA